MDVAAAAAAAAAVAVAVAVAPENRFEAAPLAEPFPRPETETGTGTRFCGTARTTEILRVPSHGEFSAFFGPLESESLPGALSSCFRNPGGLLMA